MPPAGAPRRHAQPGRFAKRWTPPCTSTQGNASPVIVAISLLLQPNPNNRRRNERLTAAAINGIGTRLIAVVVLYPIGQVAANGFVAAVGRHVEHRIGAEHHLAAARK
jgi:hypothetical protein